MPRKAALSIAIVLTALAAAGCTTERPLLPREDEIQQAPIVRITYPPYENGVPAYLPVTRFSWWPSGEPRADEVRYLSRLAVDTTGQYNESFDFTGDLMDNPERYDTLWSQWIPLEAPGDSGITTIIGDDEDVVFGYRYYFAVQGRTRGGAVTDSFSLDTNVRYYFAARSLGPMLYLAERNLANFAFLGTRYSAEKRKLPPGIPLQFRWIANDDYYHGEIVGYRYGWDVLSLEEWDAPFLPQLSSNVPATFWAGVHTLTVEAVNLEGMIARARIEIEIIPWEMDRDLLLVDDYYAPPYQVPDMSYPAEGAHDEFWEGICSRAPGFDPARDVIDTYERYLPISVEEIGRYKNMIWSASTEESNEWRRTIAFTPESAIGSSKSEIPNLVTIFLQKGGHVWTCGRADRAGGLAAMLMDYLLTFPIDLRCEMGGIASGCRDGSGISSMPYADYCVTVLDKVSGRFRSDGRMPLRSLAHYDVMVSAYSDGSDPLTSAAAGLPERLELRDEVKAAGSIFCTDPACSPGGLTYAEIYDPSYWMSVIGVPSRACFHPVYRMNAASPDSPVDGQAVALWITRFDDVVPDTPGGTAAPSIHFGFPLWYFRHESVDSIAGVVFERWGID